MNELPIAQMWPIKNKDIDFFVIPVLLIHIIVKMLRQIVYVWKHINGTVIFNQPPSGFYERMISVIFIKSLNNWPPINFMPNLSPHLIIRRIPLRQRQKAAEVIKVNPIQISKTIELFNWADAFSRVILKVIDPADKKFASGHQIAVVIWLFGVTKLVESKINVFSVKNFSWNLFGILVVVKHVQSLVITDPIMV